MGKSTGFLEYDRQVGKEIPVFERIKNFITFFKGNDYFFYPVAFTFF